MENDLNGRRLQWKTTSMEQKVDLVQNLSLALLRLQLLTLDIGDKF